MDQVVERREEVGVGEVVDMEEEGGMGRRGRRGR